MMNVQIKYLSIPKRRPQNQSKSQAHTLWNTMPCLSGVVLNLGWATSCFNLVVLLSCLASSYFHCTSLCSVMRTSSVWQTCLYCVFWIPWSCLQDFVKQEISDSEALKKLISQVYVTLWCLFFWCITKPLLLAHIFCQCQTLLLVCYYFSFL